MLEHISLIDENNGHFLQNIFENYYVNLRAY